MRQIRDLHPTGKQQGTEFQKITEGKAPKSPCGYCGVCGVLVEPELSEHGFLCEDHCAPIQNASCDDCPQELACMVRVQLGLWVVCELPSRRDIEYALKCGVKIDNVDRPLMADVHTEHVPLYEYRKDHCED